MERLFVQTEGELIQAARQGDGAAFAELLRPQDQAAFAKIARLSPLLESSFLQSVLRLVDRFDWFPDGRRVMSY